MAYVPNAQDPTEPTGDKFVASAAPEFRTLKTFTGAVYDAQLGFQAQLDALQAAIGAGTNSVALAANLGADGGSSLIGFKQAGTGAVHQTAQDILRLEINVHNFGAVGDGVTDDTAKFNAAILAATLAKAVVVSGDETYSVVVNCRRGTDYKIAGPILIPSGIILDLKGSRLIGSFAAGISTAYVNGSASVIETGYYSAGAITTNRAAPVATQRVVGSGVMNGSIINANCALNLINFNERSFIRNLEFQNCSAILRTKNCFYASFEKGMVRNSSQAANQYAILLDGASNAMRFTDFFVNGTSRGWQADAITLQAVIFENCSAEEAYVSNGVGPVDGVGLYISASAVSCAGLNISGLYFEAVKWGMQFAAGCGIYGLVVSEIGRAHV